MTTNVYPRGSRARLAFWHIQRERPVVRMSHVDSRRQAHSGEGQRSVPDPGSTAARRLATAAVAHRGRQPFRVCSIEAFDLISISDDRGGDSRRTAVGLPVDNKRHAAALSSAFTAQRHRGIQLHPAPRRHPARTAGDDREQGEHGYIGDRIRRTNGEQHVRGRHHTGEYERANDADDHAHAAERQPSA